MPDPVNATASATGVGISWALDSLGATSSEPKEKAASIPESTAAHAHAHRPTALSATGQRRDGIWCSRALAPSRRGEIASSLCSLCLQTLKGFRAASSAA